MVNVADGTLLNFEAATSHSITIRATSADGSFTTENFTISLTDVDEFDVTPVTDSNPAANSLAENSANGSLVGITASASDSDGTTNTITYSLDNNAGGRFAINASTGVVSVADGTLLNFEAATSHSITIRATSADGSFTTENFTINLTDVDEFDVTPVSDSNPAQQPRRELRQRQPGWDHRLRQRLRRHHQHDHLLAGQQRRRTFCDQRQHRCGQRSRWNAAQLRSSHLAQHHHPATSTDGSFTTENFTISLTDVDEFDVTPRQRQ